MFAAADQDLAQGYGLRLNAGTPGYASPGGLSADPLFNAPADDDFSVRAGSPHLAAGIGPRHLRQAATYRVQAPAAGQLAEAANTSFAPVGGGGGDLDQLLDIHAGCGWGALPASQIGGALLDRPKGEVHSPQKGPSGLPAMTSARTSLLASSALRDWTMVPIMAWLKALRLAGRSS